MREKEKEPKDITPYFAKMFIIPCSNCFFNRKANVFFDIKKTYDKLLKLTRVALLLKETNYGGFTSLLIVKHLPSKQSDLGDNLRIFTEHKRQKLAASRHYNKIFRPKFKFLSKSDKLSSRTTMFTKIIMFLFCSIAFVNNAISLFEKDNCPYEFDRIQGITEKCFQFSKHGYRNITRSREYCESQ